MTFDAAVLAIVDGDAATLQTLLTNEPTLIKARSTSAHHAMLIHFIAANGVEDELQRSPKNAPAIARILLEHGADPNARCDAYGGSDVLGLLLSSSHPAIAGVQAELVEVLCHAGVAIEGPENDGSPLWTAITWGYTDAAKQLVRSGARVDNVVTAAVTGELDDVKRLFGAVSLPPKYKPEHALEYALIYAGAHGRLEIVEWLLTKNPDLSVCEPVYGGTAISMAKYSHPAAGRPNGSPEVVALLEASARAR